MDLYHKSDAHMSSIMDLYKLNFFLHIIALRTKLALSREHLFSFYVYGKSLETRVPRGPWIAHLRNRSKCLRGAPFTPEEIAKIEYRMYSTNKENQ
jgi:hypothetical protein